MLPAYIIDEIRKRELEKSRVEERPQLECPVPPMLPMAPEDDDNDDDRGVVIIDL